MSAVIPWRSRIVGHGDEAPEQLLANPRNWRVHPKRQQSALAGLLDQVGWVQDVIVNRTTGHVVDGHLRVSLAISRREPSIPVVYVELDEAEEGLVLAALDPLAAMAVTDASALVELLGDVHAEDAALQSMLSAASGVPKNGKVGADEIPQEPQTSYVHRGEIYALGAHRVMCGDSTDATDVADLLGGARVDCVVTDPPYAIYGSSTGMSSSITDDKIVRPFFRDVLHAAQRATRSFAHIYIFCDWRSWPSWWEMAKTGALTPKNLLVWNKNGSGLGSNYANTYELIGFFANMPEEKTMTGAAATGQRAVLHPNVINAKRPTGDERQHNAAKPVDLLEQLIENSTDIGGLIMDLFLGSGSTLIAAERQARVCYGMEIEPKYVQMTIERWEAQTGGKAELVRG